MDNAKSKPKPLSPWATLVHANKAFGLTPEQTLNMSWQMLNCMFSELYYQNLNQRKNLDRKEKTGVDERGEYEWIEHEDFDNPGKMKRIKKYKNPV